MAHYAKVEDGVVTRVIVAEEDFFSTFIDDTPGEWLQTSFNTKGGKHHNGKEEDAGEPLRKNYACIGYAYNPTLDAFIPPQQYPSWILNEDTCLWEPPVPMPEEGQHMWDESTTSWVETTGETNE